MKKTWSYCWNLHSSPCRPWSPKLLADRINGRAYATVLRLSVCRLSVCDVMYCG